MRRELKLNLYKIFQLTHSHNTYNNAMIRPRNYGSTYVETDAHTHTRVRKQTHKYTRIRIHKGIHIQAHTHVQLRVPAVERRWKKKRLIQKPKIVSVSPFLTCIYICITLI